MTDPVRNAAGFTHREVQIILCGLMLGMFMGALNQTIVATALPHIATDLLGSNHLTWIIAVYLLTSTAATPIYGKLSDMYGRVPLLHISMVSFVIASILCAMATSMTQLIFFRALQGIGGGGLVALSHATIGDIMPPRDRGKYQAYFAGVFGAASIAGPVLGGLLADQLSWRWVFWVNVPLGILAIIVSKVTLKRLVHRPRGHRIDYLGALLIVATISCVLLVTTMGGNEVPWNSPTIYGLIAAAIALLGVAVVQEHRAMEPVMSPQFFRNRTFVLMNTMAMMSSMNLIGCTVFVPIYMQLVHSLPATDSGLMLIPLTGISFIGSICSGRIMARTGRYRYLPFFGQSLVLLGFVALCFVRETTPLWIIALPLMFCGFGLGFSGPVQMASIQNAVAHRDLGAVTAAIASFRSIGGSFGVALYGAVLIGVLNVSVGSLPGYENLGTAPATPILNAGAAAMAMAADGNREIFGMTLNGAFRALFYLGAGVSAVTALLVLVFFREIPLRTSMGMNPPEAPPKLPEVAEAAD